MSRRTPSSDQPGIQYPQGIDFETPLGQAIRNAFDNLFSLSGRLDELGKGSGLPNTLTAAQITALVRALVNKLTPRSTNVIVGTHLERITTYAAADSPAGQEFYETDRTATYIISDASGTRKWVLESANMVAAFASRPTDLGLSDIGFLFTDSSTDQETQYCWDGAEYFTVGGYLQEVADAVTNTIITMRVNRHSTSGAATTGFGGAEVTQLEDSGGTQQTAEYKSVEWTSAATNNALKRWWLRIAGTLTELLDLGVAGLTLLLGDYIWYSGTNFTGTLRHANTGNRAYDFPDADGNITYETAALTSGNLLKGGGGALVVDSGIVAAKIVSGVYTPGLTNVANLDASTAYECQYLRVGDTVTVSGKVAVDPTAPAASTQLGIALPIASNLGAAEDCAGTAFSPTIAGQGAAVLGDAANNRAQMEWISGDITNQPMYFTFTYQVI